MTLSDKSNSLADDIKNRWYDKSSAVDVKLSYSSCLSEAQTLQGVLFGKAVIASGELVFTTSLVGYVESLTDPSYFGQILTFAYPLIGNYGVPNFNLNLSTKHNNSNNLTEFSHNKKYCAQDNYGFDYELCKVPDIGYESDRIHASAVIVVINSLKAFHYSSFKSFSKWLESFNVPAVALVDTRNLITMIRQKSPILARIEPKNCNEYRNISGFCCDKEEYIDPKNHNILDYVTTDNVKLYKKDHRSGFDNPVNFGAVNYKSYKFYYDIHKPDFLLNQAKLHQSNQKQVFAASQNAKKTVRLVIIDCGVKLNLVRKMVDLGCEVLQVPWNSDLSKFDCNGFLISNGPGDPNRAVTLIGQIKKLFLEHRPILGVCLGHQILGLAAGILCEKMIYGHRSHNQPVYQPGTKKCYMSSQNHGYHLVENNHFPDDWQVWFRNANDNSIEGIKHISKDFYGVQFHPEAAAGPRDTQWLLDMFMHKLGSSK